MKYASIAQWIEHYLPVVEVMSSNLIRCVKFYLYIYSCYHNDRVAMVELVDT